MKRKKRENHAAAFANLLRINVPRKMAVILLSIFLVFIVIFTAGGILLKSILKDLPSATELEVFDPYQTTKIYSVDGKLIKEISVEKRDIVPFKKIPIHTINAALATEDHRFYSHWGVDSKRFLKCALINLAAMRYKEGFSTITMQLAKNLYYTPEKKLIRKIKEIITSIQIEKTYAKNEIIEMYLNKSYFGHGAYGIKAAAETFFNKDVEELTLSESALLIAQFKSQRNYSPVFNPEKALQRRNLILGRMRDLNMITEEEYAKAVAKPIKHNITLRTENVDIGYAPYFSEYIRLQLRDMQKTYGFNILKDGLSVYTTLDTRLQSIAEKYCYEKLPELQRIANNYSKRRKLVEMLIDKSEYDKNEIQQLLQDDKFVDSLLTSKAGVQTAFVCLDPKTGHIKALIGGRDFRESKWNRAVQMSRQPGSAFKPFLYATAIDNGYPVTYQLLNQDVVIYDHEGKRWAPQNWDNSRGGLTTLRTAISRSLNLVTVRLIQEVVPPKQVVEMAQNMGITTPLDPVDALALGTSDVIPLEIVSAFGIFPNKGIKVEPVSILRIEDAMGNIIYEHTPRRREVLNAQTAYVMTNLLESVMRGRGTGAGARTIYGFTHPAGGKSGSTNNHTDAWFIGFTHHLAAGVWVGIDDPLFTLGPRQYGAQAALPTWAKFMKAAHDTLNLPHVEFERPEGIVELEICSETKELATKYCPNVEKEIFIEKYKPEKYCEKHQFPRAINRSRSQFNHER